MKIWELEWKKINKKPFLRGIMGLAAFSLSIAMLFLFIPDEEMGRGDAMIIREWESLIVLVSCVTLFGFAVLGAVIYVNAVFKEYQGKRSLLLFSYPIERKRMFRAKAWHKYHGSGVYRKLSGAFGSGAYIECISYYAAFFWIKRDGRTCRLQSCDGGPCKRHRPDRPWNRHVQILGYDGRYSDSDYRWSDDQSVFRKYVYQNRHRDSAGSCIGGRLRRISSDGSQD